LSPREKLRLVWDDTDLIVGWHKEERHEGTKDDVNVNVEEEEKESVFRKRSMAHLLLGRLKRNIFIMSSITSLAVVIEYRSK
jgi:hypothetical protein